VCKRNPSNLYLGGSVSHRSDEPLRVPDKRETHTYTLEDLVEDAGLAGISKRRRVSTLYLCNFFCQDVGQRISCTWFFFMGVNPAAVCQGMLGSDKALQT
jgi:hypothetical protein